MRLVSRAVLTLALPLSASAQSLDLMVHNTGLSIGDSRVVHGIRLNFRDSRMREVDGLNATIWSPYDLPRGRVRGISLGLPVTGASEIRGIGVGAFGIGAAHDFTGLGVGGLGIGAGGDVSGILVGGLGVGSGGSVTGLTIGGLGAGTGGSLRGITIGGLGAGAGGSVTGFQFGGLGVGSGGRVTGISIGGLGVGAGGEVTGLQIGGVGVGAGSDVTGVSIALVGVGSGGTVRGLAMSGVGVGAPRIRGIVISALAAGGHDVFAGVLAPAYFKIESDNDGDDMGEFRGVSISAYNHIKGSQRGLTLGVINTAWELRGYQIGVLNYAANNPRGLRLLPLFNKRW